jgi:hypothetical protein
MNATCAPSRDSAGCSSRPGVLVSGTVSASTATVGRDGRRGLRRGRAARRAEQGQLRRDVGGDRDERLGLAAFGLDAFVELLGSLDRRAQDMAQLALDLGRVRAQDRIGGQVQPAGLVRAPGDRPHEAADDLTEDQRRLGGRGIHADAQPRDVDALADHVDGHDPTIG